MKIRKESILKLLLELIIVFVGVLTAFWVNSYGARSIEKENQLKVYENLYSEIGLLLQGGNYLVPHIDSTIVNWEKKLSNKKKPIPFYIRIPGVDRAPNNVWKASLQSNIVSLIDTDLMFELAVFYSNQESVFRQLEEIKEFGKTRILPFNEEEENFYSKDGALKREYEEYRFHVKELISVCQGLLQEAENLRTKIEVKIKKLS